MAGFCWSFEELSACEEALCSMKLVVTNLYTATDCRLRFMVDRVGRWSDHETIGRQCMNGCVACVPSLDMGIFVQADYPEYMRSKLRNFVPCKPLSQKKRILQKPPLESPVRHIRSCHGSGSFTIVTKNLLCVPNVPEYRRSPTWTVLKKSRRKFEIITFFRRAPYFSSRE